MNYYYVRKIIYYFLDRYCKFDVIINILIDYCYTDTYNLVYFLWSNIILRYITHAWFYTYRLTWYHAHQLIQYTIYLYVDTSNIYIVVDDSSSLLAMYSSAILYKYLRSLIYTYYRPLEHFIILINIYGRWKLKN